MGSLCSQHLKIDATSFGYSPSISHILVELDVTKKFRDKFWVGLENLGYIQSIVMEDFSSYCSLCKSLGHLKHECSILHPLITRTVDPNVYVAEEIANNVHENVLGEISINLSMHKNVNHVVVVHLDNGHLIHPSNVGDVWLSAKPKMLVSNIPMASPAIVPVLKNIVNLEAYGALIKWLMKILL